MKKVLSFVLVLVMALGMFAACTSNEPEVTSGASLAAAKEYLYTIYKDDAEVTTADYNLVSVVAIDGVSYSVTWAVDSSAVSIVPGENTVTVDLPDASEVEITYTLLATITDADGAAETVTFTHKVPAVEVINVEEGDEIVLYNPEAASYVTGIDYIYTSSSGSQKHELELTEDKAAALPLTIQNNDNDTISFVAGGKYLFCDGTDVKFVDEQGEFTQFVLEPGENGQYIRCATANYNGKAQYLELYSGLLTCYSFNAEKTGLYTFELQDAEGASGTLQDAAPVEEPEDAPAVDATDIKAVLDAAYALEPGAALEGVYTLTGKIISVDTAWSDQYQNITVTIAVDGYADQPIMCYRVKGDGAKDLAVDDEITVTGELINYNGTIEFTSGCVLGDEEAYAAANAETETVVGPTDPAEILNAAYALKPGEKLPYTSTLTGKIIATEYYWDDRYQNISVVIEVEGYEDMPVYCFRMKGEGAEDLFWGDTITVTGTLMNYQTVVEFDAGCTVSDIIPGTRVKAEPTTDLNKIFGDAAKLEAGEILMYESALTGYVSSIDTKYSEAYGNITITVMVPGYEGQLVQCYRLKGEGIENIERGDIVTVVGYIENYDGKLQMPQGCYMSAITKGDGRLPGDPLYATAAEVMEAAYALEKGATLDGGDYTLTGKITSVDTAYSTQYKNVTVTIEVEGKTIQCFRLKGTGADQIAAGDTITVTGTIKNYNGTVQFNSGCSLDAYSKAMPPAEIMEAAYALEEGKSLEGTHTLTGVITKVNTAYSSQYKNVTVTILVADKEIQCFRLKGTGADTIGVGDIITVTGVIKNYKGTVEFDSGCALDAYTKAE